MLFIQEHWYKTFMVDANVDKSEGALLLFRVASSIYGSRVRGRHELATPTFFSESLGKLTSPQLADVDGGHLALELIQSDTPVQTTDEEVFRGALETFPDQTDSGARALIQVIWNAAHVESEDNLFFHYWLSEKLRSWLGPRGFTDAKTRQVVVDLRRHAQEMLTLGINLRGRSPAEFLAARFSIANNQKTDSNSASAILNTIVSCASFAGAGLLETLDVMSLSPPCPQASCTMFGLLAGRFYGLKRLLALETHGQVFQSFLSDDHLSDGKKSW